MNIFRKQDRRDWALWSSIYYSGATAENVKKKIEAGGNVNAYYSTDYENHTMLRWAASHNDTEIIRVLLAHGADPNKALVWDAPLFESVDRRNLDAVRALLDAGADIEVKRYNDETPLISAAKAGQGDIVKLLVERSATVNAQLKDGNTALHLAAAQGYANLATYLIENGADPALTNGNLNTAADVAEKEYPGLASLIREKTPGAKPKHVEVDPGWRLVSSVEVAHVEVKNPIGYRVTEIFNFAARTYTQIATNLESKAESQTLKAFSELDTCETVDKAYGELVRLGGHADYADSGKKKLQAPGV